MTLSQIAFSLILFLTFALFLWGRWRFDIVAFAVLIFTGILGLIPPEAIFSGFSHPATITVVEVLILSRALKNAGIAEIIFKSITGLTKSVTGHLVVICLIGALLSAFMNNVGAIALLMPVAINSAIALKISPSLFLMPLSFATILGGMATLIGTPPNIIIAGYRQEHFGEPFAIFDFAYVGLPVIIGGLIFICLIGWRLLPRQVKTRTRAKGIFEIEKYVTEVEINGDSPLIGKLMASLKEAIHKYKVRILGVISDDIDYLPSSFRRELKESDSILVEGTHEDIRKLVDEYKLSFYGTNQNDKGGRQNKKLLEVLVSEDSLLVNKTLASISFHRRFASSLIAISRSSKTIRGRLKNLKFNAGDILLFYGEVDRVNDITIDLNCIPLTERELLSPVKRKLFLPIIIFALAIGLAAFNVLTLPVAFGLAILAMILFDLISPHDLYQGINWPVIVLIGSFIPLGAAFETTGLAGFLVSGVLSQAQSMPVIVVIAVLLLITMTMTDVINNTATAVIMAPIAVGLAQNLGLSPDAFLMTIAVASSCSFLTPIGHKNNALVMGPGGYKFGDYWRMGLPLEIVITFIATPLIYFIWVL